MRCQLFASPPEQANLSQLQAPRDRTVRGMLHPWQPANLTLAKPSRCHCQVPGALCAVPWGAWSLSLAPVSLPSTFLPPRVAALLLSPSPSPPSNPLRLVDFHSLLFFFSSSSCPKPSPPFCFLVRQLFSASFAPLSLCSASILQRLRRAPFPISVRRLRAVFDLFSFLSFHHIERCALLHIRRRS